MSSKSSSITTDRDHAANLGALRNALIGSVAGITEVLIQQPTIAIKNAIQQQRSVNWSPSVLYRGVGVTLGAVAPCTAIQFGMNGELLSLHRKMANESAVFASEDSIRIVSAIAAGSISALVGSPAELVMTLQQNSGYCFRKTLMQLIRDHGLLRIYRGFLLTAAREGVWCASYIALSPILTSCTQSVTSDTLSPSDTTTKKQNGVAVAAGSILSGLFTVYVTQPLDTVKTVMQGEALQSRKSLPSTLSVFRRLYREGGIFAFYRGSVPRGLRLIGAVFILGQTKQALESAFARHKAVGINQYGNEESMQQAMN